MRFLVFLAATVLGSAGAAAAQDAAAPQKPEPLKGTVVRGCLEGAKLTHIVDPERVGKNVPDTLNVTVIRVIRDQLKALNGHEVELIGSLSGIPGQESGMLVSESDKGRLYIGGGDPSLGSDLSVGRNQPPTVRAHTIRDIAPACQAGK